MLCLSYRFLARPGLRKGAVKVAKTVKVFPAKAVAHPAASVLAAPVVKPLEMVSPKVPSLDMFTASRATATPADAGKAKGASLKKAVKKPAKVVKGNTSSKVTKAKAKPVTPKLGVKKPVKRRATKKKETREAPKDATVVKPKSNQNVKSKPKRK